MFVSLTDLVSVSVSVSVSVFFSVSVFHLVNLPFLVWLAWFASSLVCCISGYLTLIVLCYSSGKSLSFSVGLLRGLSDHLSMPEECALLERFSYSTIGECLGIS